MVSGNIRDVVGILFLQGTSYRFAGEAADGFITRYQCCWLVLAMAHAICLACNSGAVGNAMYMVLNVRPNFWATACSIESDTMRPFSSHKDHWGFGLPDGLFTLHENAFTCYII